jgi:hypothetical protein
VTFGAIVCSEKGSTTLVVTARALALRTRKQSKARPIAIKMTRAPMTEPTMTPMGDSFDDAESLTPEGKVEGKDPVEEGRMLLGVPLGSERAPDISSRVEKEGVYVM